MRETFTLSEVIDRRRKTEKPWLEFLRVPALSVGIYALRAGAEDPQAPHTEDEVYYVVSGRATLVEVLNMKPSRGTRPRAKVGSASWGGIGWTRIGTRSAWARSKNGRNAGSSR